MSAPIINEERDALYGFVAQQAAMNMPRIVLDVACGDGKGASFIASAAPHAQIVGVDVAEPLVRKAKEHHASKLVSFQQEDARKLPFSDGYFDFVSSCHTLEHFDEADQRVFMRELRRTLKPGGRLVIATPDREVWALQGIAGQQEDHIRELSRAEFEGIVTQAGFLIDGVYGQALLKTASRSVLRRTLNVLKRCDVFRLRDLVRPVVKSIDRRTSPVEPDFSVRALLPGDRASVTVLVCRSISS